MSVKRDVTSRCWPIGGRSQTSRHSPEPATDDLLLEPRVRAQLGRDHHSVGGVELGVMSVVEEDPLELTGLGRDRVVLAPGPPRRRPRSPRGARSQCTVARRPRLGRIARTTPPANAARNRAGTVSRCFASSECSKVPFEGQGFSSREEDRTRVAGWEEPCHPGSMNRCGTTLTHSLPQCNPNCIRSPTSPPPPDTNAGLAPISPANAPSRSRRCGPARLQERVHGPGLGGERAVSARFRPRDVLDAGLADGPHRH